MKKLFLLAAVALSATLFTGCGNEPGGTETTPTPDTSITVKGVEITLNENAVANNAEVNATAVQAQFVATVTFNGEPEAEEPETPAEPASTSAPTYPTYTVSVVSGTPDVVTYEEVQDAGEHTYTYSLTALKVGQSLITVTVTVGEGTSAQTFSSAFTYKAPETIFDVTGLAIYANGELLVADNEGNLSFDLPYAPSSSMTVTFSAKILPADVDAVGVAWTSHDSAYNNNQGTIDESGIFEIAAGASTSANWAPGLGVPGTISVKATLSPEAVIESLAAAGVLQEEPEPAEPVTATVGINQPITEITQFGISDAPQVIGIGQELTGIAIPQGYENYTGGGVVSGTSLSITPAEATLPLAFAYYESNATGTPGSVGGKGAPSAKLSVAEYTAKAVSSIPTYAVPKVAGYTAYATGMTAGDTYFTIMAINGASAYSASAPVKVIIPVKVLPVPKIKVNDTVVETAIEVLPETEYTLSYLLEGVDYTPQNVSWTIKGPSGQLTEAFDMAKLSQGILYVTTTGFEHANLISASGWKLQVSIDGATAQLPFKKGSLGKPVTDIKWNKQSLGENNAIVDNFWNGEGNTFYSANLNNPRNKDLLFSSLTLYEGLVVFPTDADHKGDTIAKVSLDSADKTNPEIDLVIETTDILSFTSVTWLNGTSISKNSSTIRLGGWGNGGASGEWKVKVTVTATQGTAETSDDVVKVFPVFAGVE